MMCIEGTEFVREIIMVAASLCGYAGKVLKQQSGISVKSKRVVHLFVWDGEILGPSFCK